MTWPFEFLTTPEYLYAVDEEAGERGIKRADTPERVFCHPHIDLAVLPDWGPSVSSTPPSSEDPGPASWAYQARVRRA